MEITELLHKDLMIMHLEAETKEGALDEMIERLQTHDCISDKEIFKEAVMHREAKMTTGLGKGFAMPHAKSPAVTKPAILFAKSQAGIDYGALDGQPVYLFFMIAAPESAEDTHVAVLSALSKGLMKEGVLDALKAAPNPDAVAALFAPDAVGDRKKPQSGGKYIVAVTACPTGIAHTYLAEAALKQQATAMGVAIKVETHGAAGVEHTLTAGDIAQAAGVIVAADKAVEMTRFAGKPVVTRPVADAVRKPEELIAQALGGSAPPSQAPQGPKNSISSIVERFLSFERQFYNHLMSGVSVMLPFVICGGMTIALAYLLNRRIDAPVLVGYLLKIGNAAFGFMLPVLAGFIAYSIADTPGLIAGFIAGAVAHTGISFGSLSGGAPVSAGFLGALAGGFLAGGVIAGLKYLCAGFPRPLDGIKSIVMYPLFGVLITGLCMLILNIPLSRVNAGVGVFLRALSPAGGAALGGILGGIMAVDMGGRINKAAYIFGIATLGVTMPESGSLPMAAVMAGGMVPPFGTAVAVGLFRRKFTKPERRTGLVNIVMGLSFITEGAIPFCAKDPARGIPSFAAGSILAGALTGAEGIKLMSPHGGIFVILLTDRPLRYLLFIGAGAALSGVLFGLLKKAP